MNAIDLHTEAKFYLPKVFITNFGSRDLTRLCCFKTKANYITKTSESFEKVSRNRLKNLLKCLRSRREALNSWVTFIISAQTGACLEHLPLCLLKTELWHILF